MLPGSFQIFIYGKWRDFYDPTLDATTMSDDRRECVGSFLERPRNYEIYWGRMQQHTLHCQDPWFSLIRAGKKAVEGRKNMPQFEDWQAGDHLRFCLGEESFDTRIVALRRYPTVEEYLDRETLERTLPGVKCKHDGVEIYRQWSSPEEIKRYGFLAIEIVLLGTCLKSEFFAGGLKNCD